MDPSNSLQLRVEFAHTNTRLSQDLSGFGKKGSYLQSVAISCDYPSQLPLFPTVFNTVADGCIQKSSNMPVFLVPTQTTSFFPFTMIPPPPALGPPPQSSLPPPLHNYTKQLGTETNPWSAFSPLVDRQNPSTMTTESTSVSVPLVSSEAKNSVSGYTQDFSSNPCSPDCDIDPLCSWNKTSAVQRKPEGAGGTDLSDCCAHPVTTTVNSNSPGLRLLPWSVLQSTGGNWFVPRALPTSLPEINKLASNGFPLFMMTSISGPISDGCRGLISEIPNEFDVFGQRVITGQQLLQAGEELPKLNGSLSSSFNLNSYFLDPDRDPLTGFISDILINSKPLSELNAESYAVGFPNISSFVQT
ncbi:hypothetical protein FBUS_00099 [Fasciolopsis buskii]|uniref:Uncharacterized protein n=1 Tax=Fasciolopsis buskii TaxID=27845 RepID=A0A8E0VJ36_9TREM|nr:hypothetical protein FBUS_00099 [Fasciolopsis buski]